MFGQRLRELRKRSHYTQTELGKMLDKTTASVSAWEADKYLPSVETVELLARILNTSSAYLLGTTDDPLPSAFDRVRQNLTEQTFSNLLALKGYTELVDDDANITISGGGLTVDETPELIAAVMLRVQEFFDYALFMAAHPQQGV